jgi:hypothetical protein
VLKKRLKKRQQILKLFLNNRQKRKRTQKTCQAKQKLFRKKPVLRRAVLTTGKMRNKYAGKVKKSKQMELGVNY